MNKVYRHIPLSPDEYIGRISKSGKVYESAPGPDKRVGRVELENGKIYQSRFGPDQYLGRVDLEDGKVYRHRSGPDLYMGRVDKDGKCYLHARLARDEYMGKVVDMTSTAHGGAGFLLLLLPLIEEIKEDQEEAARQEAGDELADFGLDPGMQAPAT